MTEQADSSSRRDAEALREVFRRVGDPVQRQMADAASDWAYFPALSVAAVVCTLEHDDFGEGRSFPIHRRLELTDGPIGQAEGAAKVADRSGLHITVDRAGWRVIWDIALTSGAHLGGGGTEHEEDS